VKRSKIVVDSKEQALLEAGDLIIPLSNGVITEEKIYAELKDIVSGKKVGRIDDNEITLFKSCGLGLEDVAVATKLYEKAQSEGLGLRLICLRND